MGLDSLIKVAIPFVAMVVVDCSDVVISVISKAAMAKGMSNFVSVVYYNALGTLILVPLFSSGSLPSPSLALHQRIICLTPAIFFSFFFVFIFFCRKQRAPLTIHLIWRFFLLALIGSTGQMLYLTGVKLSSPTLASAITNLTPIFTFLLAVLARMEIIDLNKRASQVKCVGAIVAVAGAFIVTLYKGPAVLQGPTTGFNSIQHQPLASEESEWVLGSVLFAVVAFMAATWNVAQGATVNEYPEEMTIVFFFTLFITIQSAVFSKVLEKDPNAWKMKSSIEIIAIIYTVSKARCRCVFCFGVIGIIGIGVGFYSVMWGKVKEEQSIIVMDVRIIEGTEEEPFI
ncbi:WAT1-related protein At5g40240 [Linum perenne]